jgi:hypothetical protein
MYKPVELPSLQEIQDMDKQRGYLHWLVQRYNP